MEKQNIKNKKFWDKFNLFCKRTKWIVISIDILLIILSIWFSIQPINFLTKFYVTNSYEGYVNKYSNDVYILNITNGCKNATDVVECVWESVPYEYNHERMKKSIATYFYFGPVILSPEEYFRSGGYGVCRDNAVMIRSILNNLNINNTFTLEPRHIYVTAYYNNKTYVINTYLQVTNNISIFEKYKV
jgi:hypothetical protein